MAEANTPELVLLQSAVAGRYSLEREVGRGGMGVVYLARDVALERPVAIKALPRHMAQDASLRARFLREARTAAALMHPHIVPIYLVEAHDDLVFFVMAFVDGETLAERVRRKGPLGASEATRLMQEVAWALGYAHGRGVIHRDVKPDNILLEHASGRALVADFGIARAAASDTQSSDGVLVGTVQYMSPEQASAEPLDGRSDLYSLGATVYFALSGVSPVEAPSLPAMLTRLATEDPAPLTSLAPGVPTDLASIVMRTLAKHPAERFESADVLASTLQRSVSVAETRPEVRSFLREVGAVVPVVVTGVTLMLGSVVLRVFGALPTPVIGRVVFWLGGGAAALAALAVGGAVLQLRREHVPWSEAESAIVRERRDQSEARSRLRRGALSRRLFAITGGFLTFIGATQLGFALLSYRDHLPDVAAGILPGALGGLALGITGLVASQSRRIPDASFALFAGAPEKGTDTYLLASLQWLMRWKPLARFYARGVGPALGVSSSPTATLLVERVEELVAQLPEQLRVRLGDVLPVAVGLERVIAALRARCAQLDRAIAELPAGAASRAEFGQARERTAQRLTDCVSALEGVRTDLLRLDVGLIAIDGITLELERARELSVAVDAELYGLDETRRIQER